MFKSLSIAQLKWKAVYTLCGCFFLSATLAIDYSLQHWIWEFSFWGSGRCSPPQLIYQVYRIYINRKSVIYSPRASQNCKLQFQAKQCCNIFQENMSTWAVPFCTWHSLQRLSSTGDRSKDCPLINGHTCSVAISWTSTTCFGAITPRTPSRPLRFWN